MLDALMDLASPGGAVDPASSLRVANDGAVVDHSGARPFSVDLESDRWYGWLLEDTHRHVETGPAAREDFAFGLMYVAEASEQSEQARARAVSELMDQRAHAFLGRLDANDANGIWLGASGAIDQSVITGFSVRGIGLRVTGWRFRPT